MPLQSILKIPTFKKYKYDPNWSEKFTKNHIGRRIIKLSNMINKNGDFYTTSDELNFFNIFANMGNLIVDFDNRHNPNDRKYYFDYNRNACDNLKNILNQV